MLAKVQKVINQEKLLLFGESLVVGVSGGVDSTALLHILCQLNDKYDYRWKITVVHLNHCFRGAESDADAAYVEQFCHTVGVKCYSFRRDVPSYMKEQKMGAQEASRMLRYQLYRQVAEQESATKVVLAHHADDQVETILFRIVRGTRTHGLAGIPRRRWLVPEQIEVVRPLLSITRKELEAYVSEVGLTPCEDSSNTSRKYARNRLRLDVLPILAEINERYAEHMLQLAEASRLDDEYLMKVSRSRLETIIESKEAKKIVISRKKFQCCDLALQSRMITLLLSYLSSGMEWSSQHVEAVLHVIKQENPSARINLPANLVVQRVYQHISFQAGDGYALDSFCYPLEVPGTTRIGEVGAVIHAWILNVVPSVPIRELPATVAVFDYAELSGKCLLVRSRQVGDRIQRFGSDGTTKLKEVLIDAKVPKMWRDRLPLVCADDTLLWVPQVKRSAHAVVDEQTKQVLYVEVEFGKEWQEVFHE